MRVWTQPRTSFRLQELAVLGVNDAIRSKLVAIDAEAEAIADEFHRLMSTSTYQGQDVFADTASSEYVLRWA